MLERELINSWPEEFDPRLEIVKDYGLFILIAKPIRLNKPERDLTALAPRTEFDNQFVLRDVYQMRIMPYGTAGFHYHKHKLEIIYPLNYIELHLREVDTGRNIAISVPERVRDTRFGVLVKHNVAHAIHNPTSQESFYTVLSNMLEEDAQKSGDIISFNFSLQKAIPLTKFIEFNR